MAAFTSKAAGNWSASGQTTWNEVGVPGSGDTATVNHAVTVNVSTTVGASLQGTGWAVVGINLTTGAVVTGLATGTYRASFTTVSSAGETGAGLTDTSLGTITISSSKPRVTLPAAAPASCTYNLYLTNTGGGANTEHLYCTGITGSTVDLTGGLWGNTYAGGQATGGATAYASAAAPPTDASVAAISIGTAGSLVWTNNVKLTVKGNLMLTSAAIGTRNNIPVTQGGSIVFDPTGAVDRTRAGYAFHFLNGGTVTFAGVNGTRCACNTLRTNGDEARSFFIRNNQSTFRMGCLSATYTDFNDLGDATNFGVSGSDDLSGSTTDMTFDHCTFTSAGIKCNLGSTWDKNFAFTNNIFRTSVGTVSSGVPRSAEIDFAFALSAGTRVLKYNDFDKSIFFTSRQLQIAYNVFRGKNSFAASLVWTDNQYYNNNVEYNDTGSGQPANGSSKDVYVVSSTLSLEGSLLSGLAGATLTFDGFIFDDVNPGQNNSDGFLIGSNPASTAEIVIKNCIALPNGQKPAISTANIADHIPVSVNVHVTVEHNTYCYTDDVSCVYLGEAGNTSFTAAVRSVRANLCFNPISGPPSTANTSVLYDKTTNNAIDAFTTAGYNGFQPPVTSYNNIIAGNTVSLPGYRAAKWTSYSNIGDGTGPNANPTNDVTGDPQFVDKTRDILAWGASPQGANLTTPTILQVLDFIGANPLTYVPAMMQWVRNGFRPQNSSFAGASYPGDASTLDANGQAWPGGLPTLGAMSILSSTPVGPRTSFEGGFSPQFQGGFSA